MRILVIGGTGFIGSFVIRQLCHQVHEVTVFHRGQTNPEFPPGVSHIAGNRLEIANFTEDFRRLAPDVVLDMILASQRPAQALMSAVKGITRRVVVASSIDVYRAYGRVRGFEPGPPDPIPLTENSPLRERLRPHSAEEISRMSRSPYFQDNFENIEVEQAIMSDPELPGTVLRLPAVYGPGDHQHRVFFDGLKRMDDGRPAILMQDNLARWRWSRGYVENVAGAIALAVTNERASGRIYNVAEPDAMTYADWTRAIGDAVGWHGDIIALLKDQLPEHLKNSLESEQEWVVSTARIRQELGYTESVPRDEALRRAVAWERVNPPKIDLGRFDYAAEDAVLDRLKQRG